MSPQDQWSYERRARVRGFTRIAGVDEAGRGPLAGPVVAAAVVLPAEMCDQPDIGITDSKQLSAQNREALYEEIYARALSVGIGIVDAAEIDRINVLQAACRAMAMALYNISPTADFVLVDGNCPIPVDTAQETVVRGDCLSMSIAAASIVAKVSRDRMMRLYDLEYPEYDFAANKGYATASHRAAIALYGASLIHRRSFNGVLPPDER
jgi:ribonuclease HII